MKEYLTPLDEVLLLDAGFKYGLDDVVLKRQSVSGDWYFMDTSVPGEYQTWYKPLPAGNLGPSFPMTRSNFYKLFSPAEV